MSAQAALSGKMNDDATSIPSPTNLLDLPADLLGTCLAFVGSGYYRYVAGTCRAFRDASNNRRGEEQTTTWSVAASSISCAKVCLEDKKYETLRRKKRTVRSIVLAAGKTGKVNVLEWVRKQNYPYCGAKLISTLACNEACKHGQVTVLQWAHEKDLDWTSYDQGRFACESGHVDVLDFLFEHARHDTLTANKGLLGVDAIGGGHVAVLEWLHERDLLEDGHKLTDYAVFECHSPPVLDWLLSHGYPFRPDSLLCYAASRGHVHILEWAKARGIPVNHRSEFCTAAARRGQLRALQWLRQNDCPWDGRVIEYALENGHEEVVLWARENGCPEP